MKNLLLLTLLAAIMVFSSCKKEPPKAVIKVIDEMGNAVPGAEILITADEGRGYIQPDNVRELKLYANASGIVERTFYDDAIYDVLARQYDEDNIVVKSGSGVLVLEKDQVYNETITIRP
jgi:hypothetical protein